MEKRAARRHGCRVQEEVRLKLEFSDTLVDTGGRLAAVCTGSYLFFWLSRETSCCCSDYLGESPSMECVPKPKKVPKLEISQRFCMVSPSVSSFLAELRQERLQFRPGDLQKVHDRSNPLFG